MKKMSVIKITQTAMVSAVALVLSFIEMSMPDIPFVLPGMKLGLSNIATMFALSALSLPSAIVVCLTKALFALLMRGFTAFLMSLCGGVLSVITMYLIMRIEQFGYVAVGIGGAFAHNLGQILVAFLLTDYTVFSYFSVLCVCSLATGTVTALCVYLILPKVMKLRLFEN